MGAVVVHVPGAVVRLGGSPVAPFWGRGGGSVEEGTRGDGFDKVAGRGCSCVGPRRLKGDDVGRKGKEGTAAVWGKPEPDSAGYVWVTLGVLTETLGSLRGEPGREVCGAGERHSP